MTAWFRDRRATDPVEVVHDIAQVGAGRWAVVITFEGELTAIRYAAWTRPGSPSSGQGDAAGWPGTSGAWRSSLDHAAYTAAVREVRERIAAGTVYQVNICRVLRAPLPDRARITDLGAVLAQGNPAPYASVIDEPDLGVEIACASPELYLSRQGSRVLSRPIKGTARVVEELLAKDYDENVMIVDLVRNDIGHVSRPGTIRVEHLYRPEPHPGLVHLVSDVSGQLRAGVGWPAVLEATFPPGSVSGAPKHTAMQAIADLEPVPRGPYCGAIGWIDADRDEAELAVGIRTFWASRDEHGQRSLHFGTGAGITWGSDPEGEWVETELKAARLVALADGRMTP